MSLCAHTPAATAGPPLSHQQPICRTYKNFNAAVSNSGTLLDTISVPDAYSVGSVRVASLSLGHPEPSTLQLSLLHRAAPNAPLASSPLTPLADSPAPGGALMAGPAIAAKPSRRV